MSVPALEEQFIIPRFGMPDVRHHGEPDGIGVKRLGGRRPSDSAAVLSAGMRRDLEFPTRRTARIQLPDAVSKGLHIQLVQLRAPFGGSRPRRFAGGLIGRAVPFRLLQRPFLDQQSLPLISVSACDSIPGRRRTVGNASAPGA